MLRNELNHEISVNVPNELLNVIFSYTRPNLLFATTRNQESWKMLFKQHFPHRNPVTDSWHEDFKLAYAQEYQTFGANEKKLISTIKSNNDLEFIIIAKELIKIKGVENFLTILSNKDWYNKSILMWAQNIKNQGILDFIFETVETGFKSSDCLTTDKEGKTLLYWMFECHKSLDEVQAYFKSIPSDQINPLLDTRNKNKTHLIHIAAKQGLLDIFKYLLTINSDYLELLDDNKQSPLIWAAARGHSSIVNYMLTDTRVNLYAGTKSYPNRKKTALHWAIENGHTDIAITLLETDNNFLEHTDNNNCTPIFLAAATGQLKLVQYLINKKVNLEIVNKPWLHDDTDLQTPFYAAVFGKHTEVALALLQANAKFDIVAGKDKNHVIHIAAETGQFEIVKKIIELDILLVNKENVFGITPLINALDFREIKRKTESHKRLQLISYLLEKGANVNHVVKRNSCDSIMVGDLFLISPLRQAINNNAPLQIIKELLQAGASLTVLLEEKENHCIHLEMPFEILEYLLKTYPDSLNNKDEYGQTPLYLAISWYRQYDREKKNDNLIKIINYLIELKADVNIVATRPPSDFRMPLLSSAITNGLPLDIISKIIDSGTHCILPEINLLPLSVAIRGHHLDIVKMILKKHPLLIEHPDNQGKTPLMLAIFHRKEKIIHFLINEQNANINAIIDSPGRSEHNQSLLYWVIALANEEPKYELTEFTAKAFYHKIAIELKNLGAKAFITAGNQVLPYETKTTKSKQGDETKTTESQQDVFEICIEKELTQQLTHSFFSFSNSRTNEDRYKRTIDELPNGFLENLSHIFSFLKTTDLIHLSRVNSFFYSTATLEHSKNSHLHNTSDIIFTDYRNRYERRSCVLPNKQLAIQYANNNIEIWDYEKEKVIKAMQIEIESGFYHIESRNLIYINEHNILASFKDKSLKLINYKNGTCHKELKSPELIMRLEKLSPNKIALGYYAGTIQVLDLDSFELGIAFGPAYPSQYISLAKVNECQIALTNRGMIEIWNHETGQLIRQLCSNEYDEAAGSILHLDNNKIASTHETGLYIWDCESGKSIQLINRCNHESAKNDVIIRIGKDKIACLRLNRTVDKNEVDIWNFNTGKLLQTISNHKTSIIYTAGM